MSPSLSSMSNGHSDPSPPRPPPLSSSPPPAPPTPSPSSTAPSTSPLRLLILETSPPPPNLLLPNPSSSSSSSPSSLSFIPPLLHALTGEWPPPLEEGGRERRSYAGYTTHSPLRLRTRYFDVRVRVWCDEVPLQGRGGEKEEGGGRGDGGGREVGRGLGVETEEGGGGVGSERMDAMEDLGIYATSRKGAARRREGEGEGGSLEAIGTEHSDQKHSWSVISDGEAEREGRSHASSERTEWHEPQNSDDDEGDDDDAATTNEENVTTQNWLHQMLSPAAAEVRSVIGAIILTLPITHAFQPLPSTATDPKPSPATLDRDYDYDSISMPHATTPEWKLKDEYLDAIEAVNTLRSAIEEERAAVGGDVGAVLLLQGSASRSCSESKSRTSDSKPATFGNEGFTALNTNATAADKTSDDSLPLTESTEEQLLTERAILGWDVVAWDCDGLLPPNSTIALHGSNLHKGKSGTADEDTRAVARTERNIYGEKTGLARLTEVLEAVDWTADFTTITITTSTSTSTALHDQEHQTKKVETSGPSSPPLPSASPSISPNPFNDLPANPDEEEEEEEEEEEGEEELHVEQLQSLLQHALAIKEAGAEMPRRERERYARRMVGRLLGGEDF